MYLESEIDLFKNLPDAKKGYIGLWGELFLIASSSNQLKVLEYERFVNQRYGAFTENMTHRNGLGTTSKDRESFLSYVKAKFKLIRKQGNKDYSFLDLNNKFLKKEIKKKKINF